jgi:GNAT superfamily N-acetyltransferase
MEYRVVSTSETDRIADLHPELMASRPDLAEYPFSRNPVAAPDDFPFLFYVLDGDVIAGFRKAIPEIVYLGGQQQPWAWAFDSFIEPDYRGRGVGGHLVELQVEEIGKRGIASGAAFSAPAMLRIYRRLGFRVAGHAPRMCLVRNARPFLRPRLRGGPLLAVGSGAGNAALAFERALRGALHPVGRFEIRSIGADLFAELFDRSAVRTEPNYWAGEANWILARLRADDALYQLARGGESVPCALLVLRDRLQAQPRTGPVRRLTLMEFAPLDEGADVPALIAAALGRLLLSSHADVADVVTSWPPLLAALAARGFRQRGEGMSFVYKFPPGTPDAPDAGLESWHLTHFCSDGFLLD